MTEDEADEDRKRTDDDPFDDLEAAVGDREGDPFAGLGIGPEDGSSTGTDDDEQRDRHEAADDVAEGGDNVERDDGSETDAAEDVVRADEGGGTDDPTKAEDTGEVTETVESVGPGGSSADEEAAKDNGFEGIEDDPEEAAGVKRTWPTPSAEDSDPSAGTGSDTGDDASFDLETEGDDGPAVGTGLDESVSTDVDVNGPAEIGVVVDPDEEPAEDDPFTSASLDFAEVDLAGIDEGEIWDTLAAARAADSVGDVHDQTYAAVSKHSYCEQCEYFTGPPEASCTHEGTRIVEFVDMETVGVVDCPVVAERRRLEREH